MSLLKFEHGVRSIVSIRPSDRKLLLIEVAEFLFAKLGFAETTVHTIAFRAGVPVHVVYHLFGSKAGLLHEVESARAGRVRQSAS